jgi:hypothetical protein
VSRPLRAHVALIFFGTALGFALSRVGFSDYGELHRMLTLADLRLLFSFVFAVALLFVGFTLLARRQSLAPRALHPGVVPGAALFGVGWAVGGACPTIALVQLGEGQLAAGLTLGGIVLGNWVYGRLHRRFFRWDPGSCDSV